ncbi:MAG: S9 family peptidase, partial [Saprospiraceae bacterium]|nr:S9 family peptidase [Saprospiraceae bacterium]
MLVQCADNESVNKISTMMLQKDVKYPIADKKPHKIITHNDTRVDDYYWMKLSDEQKNAANPDTQTQKVLDYLNAENNYSDKMTEHLNGFKEKLFDEIVGRIKQTDMSVPYFKNGYYYQSQYEEGQEYPIYTRMKDNLEADPNLLLDVNELAKEYEYFSARGLSVSPNNEILAYGEDTLSRRIYTIKFKSLKDGTYLDDIIENTTGSVVWANDNKTVFYTRKDAALRAFKIFKHKLGTPSSEDEEVYHEADETFSTYVYKTKSEKYIVIGSYATVSNEYRIVNANTPDDAFLVFEPRKRDHEFSISHFEDNWYIVTNKDGAKNFKVMKTSEAKTTSENWKPFIEHNKKVLISNLEIFKNYLVINERSDGITKVKIMPWKDLDNHHYVDFGEDAYMAFTSTNVEYDTDVVRIYFSSLTTPGTTYDYDMNSKSLELMKRQEVVGDFNPDDYTSERFMVKARDGASVPVSLVYKKGFKKDGTEPLLLYAYGSYGSSMDPYFSSVRLSLLDRGFAFAIAHIRGGQEMGRQWYDDGKLLNKKNTFTDFIDVGKDLVEKKYTNSDNLYCMGGSAGGLLIGAVINMEPSLWKGAIAAVPFVDVVTT